MPPSYSLNDIVICIPYWSGNAAEMRASVNQIGGAYHDVLISVYADDLARQSAMNPCVPINRAVAQCSKPVVVLTNPGIEIKPGMLQRMLAELDEYTYVAAACRDVDTGRWLCHSTIKGGEYGRGPMPPGSGFHFLAMLTRSLWDRAGGFDEDYRDGQAYDDNDFLWRLHRAGAKFKVLDEVVVDHRRSETAWPEGGLARNRARFEAKWSNYIK